MVNPGVTFFYGDESEPKVMVKKMNHGDDLGRVGSR